MRFLCCSVLVAVLAIAGAARADDDLARARALFDEAGARERVGDWRGAQDRLRAALRIRETPHLHYALGWALEKGDDAPAARSEYRVALDQAERANVTEVATLARARLAAISPAEASDDRGADPPARQDPTPTPVATRDAPAASREEPSVLPWALVGVGGALALGGGALLVASTHDVATRDDATNRWCAATSCTGGTTATRPETPEAAAYRREALDASTQGNTKQVIGVALAGVGVVSAAVGAFLLVRRGPSVGATVAPGLAVASATFRF